VGDNGRGLDSSVLRTGGTRGVGLAGIRRRAQEIGARVSWIAPERGGTTMDLLFSPTAVATKRIRPLGPGASRSGSHHRATGSAASGEP
jgi:hypothetical protein